MNESQPSVTEYLSASSCEYSRSCQYGSAMALTLSFDTIMTACYEIQYMWTARSTETETETGLDRYVMLGARWLTEY